MKLFNKKITSRKHSPNDKHYHAVVDVKRGLKSSDSLSFMTSDIHTGVLTLELIDGDLPYNVSGCKVSATISCPDSTVLEIPCEMLDDNIVEIHLGIEGTYQEGAYTFDLKIDRGNARIVGIPTITYNVLSSIVEKSVDDDKFQILDKLISQAKDRLDRFDVAMSGITSDSEVREARDGENLLYDRLKRDLDYSKSIDAKVEQVAESVTELESNVGNIVQSNLTQLDNRITQVDNRITQVNSIVTQVDNRVTQVNNRITQVDNRVTQVDDRVTQEVNTINSSIADLNLKVDHMGVESHTTNNGIVDFTCDNNGYVDNVAIEGKTLVNLFSFKKTESSNNNSVWVHINTDYISLFKEVEYTLINTSDKNILVDIYNNDTNSYKRNLLIKANSSIKDTLTSNEHYSKCTGLFSDSWSLSDLSVISSTLIILKGNHTDKPISYFEGLKSVGQGDKIDVLTTPIHNNLIPQNYTKGEGYWTSMVDVGSVFSDSNWYRILEYIPVKPNTKYTGLYTGTQVVYYDENKNTIYHNQSDLVLGYEYHIFTTPQNAKYIRVSYPKDKEGNICIFEGVKHDKKQIPTTLRSLPNGVKDTVEKIGNKYVKVQRCGEVVLDGNVNVSDVYKPNNSTSLNYHRFLVGVEETPNFGDVFCDRLGNVGDYEIEKDNILADKTYGGFFITLHNDKTGGTREGLKTWLQANPITVVYELATPQIIELPNFNPQTYKGENTLMLNSGVIQCDASFDVCKGIRSELDVIKDKVSSLDNYEGRYEFSNEVVYLNGTYKPGFAETPYIVRIGKICILHCAIGNDAPQRGMHVLKLPSFAKPKDHHRCAGRAKINDETINPILVDYDITLDNTVQIWTTHETTKLNEMYIHMIWEVE